MVDDRNEPDDSDNFEIPPSFFPFEGQMPNREMGASKEWIEVQIEGVFQAENDGSTSRFVLLSDGERKLPIIIGPFEATAIILPLEGQRPDRPMTHDLIKNLLDKLGGHLERVVIDDLWNGIYYAKLHIKRGKEELELDVRPSDALALAVRYSAPVFVIEGILESTPESL